MSILTKLIGGAAVQPIEAIGNVITGIFGGAGEKLSHEEVMARIAQRPGEIQAEINKIEAQHRSIFVAGWRPFIGWVCGLALGYHYLGSPLIGIWVTDLPALQTDGLTQLVFAMLGLGGLRSFEKVQGRTK